LMGELWPGGVRSAATEAAGSVGLNAPRVVEKPWARIELRVVHAVRIPDARAYVTDARWLIRSVSGEKPPRMPKSPATTYLAEELPPQYFRRWRA
jgi:hypothetical protein